MFFYMNQEFPLSDKLWEGIDSDFETYFLKELYYTDIKRKLIFGRNFNIVIPKIFYPILINHHKKLIDLTSSLPEEFVGVNFRKDWGHFFSGTHSLREDMVLSSVTNSIEFKSIFNKFSDLEGDCGDASYIIEPLKGVFVKYIYWNGDEDFPHSLKILFDKKLTTIFKQDMVWGILVEINSRIKNYANYFNIFH